MAFMGPKSLPTKRTSSSGLYSTAMFSLPSTFMAAIEDKQQNTIVRKTSVCRLQKYSQYGHASWNDE
jgi:hypothetical protein